MPNATGNTCVIHFFNTLDDTNEGNIDNTNLKTYYSPIWDGNGNLVQFTIEKNTAYNYFRIQCGGINETSIITINEPIE